MVEYFRGEITKGAFVFEMDKEKQWYTLVKHNSIKPDPTTKVVRTVRGLRYAQQMADALTERRTPEEKEVGFQVHWV